jgi:hypothetical protein
MLQDLLQSAASVLPSWPRLITVAPAVHSDDASPPSTPKSSPAFPDSRAVPEPKHVVNHPCRALPFGLGPAVVKLFHIPPHYFTVVFTAMLMIQLVALYFFKEPVQASSGHVTLLFQRWLVHKDIPYWSMYLHNLISSHLWLSLCAFLYWYTIPPLSPSNASVWRAPCFSVCVVCG